MAQSRHRATPKSIKTKVFDDIVATTTSGDSPILTSAEYLTLAKTAFLDMWQDLEGHGKYSTTWYHTLNDAANNGFMQLSGDRRNSVGGGGATFVGRGFTDPFWVNHNKVIKFNSAEGAAAFTALKLKIGEHIANYIATRDPESRGDNRSGSPEETDYNDMVAAYTTAFGAI